jgi:transposase, IS30 family
VVLLKSLTNKLNNTMPGSHLTQDQRSTLFKCNVKCVPMRETARQVGCSLATAYRELNRGALDGEYLPERAHAMAKARSRVRRKRSKDTFERRLDLEHQLKKDWSPDVIAGRQKAVDEGNPPADTSFLPFPTDDAEVAASWAALHERYQRMFVLPGISRTTIYKIIEQDKKDGGTLFTLLPNKGRRNRKRPTKARAKGKLPVKPEQELAMRPVTVESRDVPGHWEADLVFAGDTVLLTAIDRTTRQCFLEAISSKEAGPIADILEEFCLTHRVRTITLDRGLEWSKLQHVVDRLEAAGIKVNLYYCAAYHSWEKGSIEQFNGLLRRYYPKGENFPWNDQRRAQAREIMKRLNSIPRKVLGYLTPDEVSAQWSDTQVKANWPQSMIPRMPAE